MMFKHTAALFLSASLLAPVAVSAQIADTVLINGKIYTADAKDRVVTALATSKGRFVAVGTDKAIKRHIGPRT